VLCIPIEEAGSRIEQLIEKAREGEEVIITRGEEHLARIQPMRPQRPDRTPGTAKGLILHMADDFDATPEEFQDYL
jgi:prevent-host-death family protein